MLIESIKLRNEIGDFVELSNVERLWDGSFRAGSITVQVCGFALTGGGDEFNRHAILIYEEILSVYQNMDGIIQLGTDGGHFFCKIEVSKRGQINVSGHLVLGLNRDNNLNFVFESDQTFLPDFISGFKKLSESSI